MRTARILGLALLLVLPWICPRSLFHIVAVSLVFAVAVLGQNVLVGVPSEYIAISSPLSTARARSAGIRPSSRRIPGPKLLKGLTTLTGKSRVFANT